MLGHGTQQVSGKLIFGAAMSGLREVRGVRRRLRNLGLAPAIRVRCGKERLCPLRRSGALLGRLDV